MKLFHVLCLMVALSLVASPVVGSEPSLQVRDICSNTACESEDTVFQVDQDGGMVAHGTLGFGTIPAEGPGLRTMWYPFKGAFRTGNAGDEMDADAWDNANIGFYSFATGIGTRATAFGAAAFGDETTASAAGAAVFGVSNTVSGAVGLSAGANNLCSGFSCVALGYQNEATAQGSIAIGYRSTASANYGLALGHRASTNGRAGAMVFGDASTTNFVESTANNQFMVRAAGGYRLFSNASLSSGVSLAAGGGSWSSLSDRNAKRDIEPVDGEQLLGQMAKLPVMTWRYTDEDPAVRHIGPMAQDWQELVAGPLGLNDDDRHINQGDFDGANLLAVIALEARTRQLAEENATLKAQLGELQEYRAVEQAQREKDLARFEQLEKQFQVLLAKVSGSSDEPAALAATP